MLKLIFGDFPIGIIFIMDYSQSIKFIYSVRNLPILFDITGNDLNDLIQISRNKIKNIQLF